MSVLFDYCLSVLIYSLFSFALFASSALISAYRKVHFVYLKLERTFCLSNFGGRILLPQLVTFGTNLQPPKSLPLYSFTHDSPSNLLRISLLMIVDNWIYTCEYLTLSGNIDYIFYRLSA